MLAATTRPWYLPTWVSGQMPVTSPIAHRRSPARSRASTGMPRPSASMPTVSRPMPRRAGAGRWRRAGGRRAARGRRRARGRSPRRRAARRSRARRGRARCRRGAGPRRAPRPAAPARARARARPPSTSATSPPRRRTACAISTPTGPPPRTSSRRGTAFMPVASRLVQIPSSSRSPGIGGMNGSAPLATHDVVGGVAHAVDLDHARPGEPAAAAQQVDAVLAPASAPARRRSSRRP